MCFKAREAREWRCLQLTWRPTGARKMSFPSDRYAWPTLRPDNHAV